MATKNDSLHDLRSHLSDEFDMDTDDVSAMLDMFFDSIGGLIGDAEASLQHGRQEEICSIGHTIKGSAANVGASAISGMALALESEAKKNNLPKCRKIIPLIRDAFDKLYSEHKK